MAVEQQTIEAGQRSRSSAWLHRYAVGSAACTLLLITAGALVVGNEASLAVPDWPLSYGQWMPPMEGGIFYEHGHRMIATFVGLLTTILAIWLWRSEPRNWVRRLGWVALAVVIAQGLLGGITVLYLLPTPISVSHACLAQLFFCIMLTLALVTGNWWREPAVAVEEKGSPAFRHLCAAASGVIFLQLATGAALRHKAFSVAPHLAWAAIVAIVVGWLVLRATSEMKQQSLLRRIALLTGVLLVAQLGLGTASYLVRLAHAEAPQPIPAVIWTTTAHVVVGALLLGSSWVLTLLSFRRTQTPGMVRAMQETPQKSLA